MVEPQPSKLAMRVRFPSPAPHDKAQVSALLRAGHSRKLGVVVADMSQAPRAAVAALRVGWRHWIQPTMRDEPPSGIRSRV